MVVTTAIAGCASEPAPDLGPRAEALCLDEEYAEAVPLLKQQLLNNPEDSAAHYYLGRCFLFGVDGGSAIHAKGEFEIALSLFNQQGRKSPIARFSDDYFETICNVDIGKAYLLQVLTLPDGLVNTRPIVLSILDECEIYYERAQEIMPDSEATEWLRNQIGAVRDVYGPRYNRVPLLQQQRM